jgi:hypothetical protein
VLVAAVYDGCEHRVGVLGPVGAVAVQHQDVLGVDVPDRLPNRLSLAGAGLLQHSRTVIAGDLGGFVGGVAVDDEDVLVAATREPVDDLADGLGLVQRRNEDTHVVGNGH